VSQPNAPEARLSLVVSGRVQGVGFRWWTLRTATRLGLRGTVRNLRDGTVEVQAAGPPAAVVSFRELLGAGPPGARVDRLRPAAPAPSLPADFRIVG